MNCRRSGTRTIAALAAVVAVAAGVVVGAWPAAARSPTRSAVPVVTITDVKGSPTVQGAFDVSGVRPGEHRSLPITFRNVSRVDAVITFRGYTYDAQTGRAAAVLAEHSMLTLRRAGAVLGTGGTADGNAAGGPLGVSFTVRAGAAMRLDSELVLDGSVGRVPARRAQQIRFHFVVGDRVPVESAAAAGAVPPGTAKPHGADGRSVTVAPPPTTERPPATLHPTRLPSAGTSLSQLHVAVWTTIASGALLAVLIVVRMSRRIRSTTGANSEEVEPPP